MNKVAETLAEILAGHRAWVWNRFKEQNGRHVIAVHETTGVSHVFRRDGDGGLTIVCPKPQVEGCYNYALSCWPTCPECACYIYDHCSTSFPEEVSVQSQVSGTSGQLVLPNSENWGL